MDLQQNENCGVVAQPGVRNPAPPNEGTESPETPSQGSSAVSTAITEHDFLYPVEGLLDCGACRAEGKVRTFLEARDLVKHAEQEHPRITLTAKCRGCEREFPGLHNVRCHQRFCTKTPATEIGEFPCSNCHRRFETQRGLSTHEIRAHPLVRNQARMGARASQPPQPARGSPPTRKGRKWSDEEVELLQKLELEFAGARNINVLLEPYFPSKDQRQIRSKRSDLLRAKHRVERRAGSPVSEGASLVENPLPVIQEQPDKTNEINSNNNRIYQPVAEILEDKDDDRAWKGALAASAVRTFHKQEKILKDGYFELGAQLATIGRRIKNDPNDLQDAHLALESIIDRLTSMIASRGPRHRRRKRPSRTTRRRKGNTIRTRTAKRRHNYARAQELAKSDMRLLATLVTENRLGELEEPKQPPPATAEVQTLYQELWGSGNETSFPDNWKQKVETRSATVLIPPIQLEAVRKRFQALKAETAAGFDGIGKKDIPSEALVILTLAYNLCLATGYYPLAWKKNRTTLIPKAGKDPSQVVNWRPITIGSVFGRIFSGIIDSGLRQNTRFSYRQKGFTSESGTFNNVALLQQILAIMKREAGGICSILDISKAFDSVPHGAIAPALRRLGVPLVVAQYICEMYAGSTTSIRCGDGEAEIRLLRGVKQGDPLSPF